MIRVVAILTAKPGRRDEVLTAFSANVPNVRAEEGCIEYAAFLDTENVGPVQTKVGPDAFVVLESWESVDALKAHGAAPHMIAYARQTKDLLASRVVHVFSAVG